MHFCSLALLSGCGGMRTRKAQGHRKCISSSCSHHTPHKGKNTTLLPGRNQHDGGLLDCQCNVFSIQFIAAVLRGNKWFCCLCCQIIDYIWKHKTNEKNTVQKPSDCRASGIGKETVSLLFTAHWALKI